ncbi:FecCD family ABC transporter permease [Crossiella cryophila]|uniref:Iron complex transport system permease protein n=1 Tax=Crossiella cryophila TaxID=43355 RepID=A0A7W7FVC7_9PSEU|nr:iron chelate uptake ABC transporter family permease subunit [Crossiella cryophila]MBB4678905.1 iron complex transport system permease protein [Crossiella cryophila]
MVEVLATRGGSPPRTARARGIALRAGGLLLAVLALAVVCLLSVWFGLKSIPFADIWSVLWHNDGSAEAVIVHELRIPRTLLGLLVGAALGLSGALMQALSRNALADPGLLGVTMGASTAVVIGIAFLGVSGTTGSIVLGFAGAAIASLVVYVLGSTGRAAVTPDRLIMAGAAITAVLLAFNTAVLLLDPASFNQFRYWNAGSLAGRRMDVVTVVAPFLGAGILLALGLARPLNGLALGEETGRALGVHMGRTRWLGALAITVLCGAATAAAGPISFLGLAVPHLARLLVGADQRWVLPFSAVLAPMLLLGADILGRLLVAPAELAVGIVTAFLGAPVFLALCRRRKLVHS